jgi:valyl-tRNA synthetase
MDWDWVISRQRIFATPIPVWVCDECGKVELPNPEDLPIDPTVDSPKEKCECGSDKFTGETDVLDTWMDSSITPMVIAGWPDEEFHKLYPSSLRQQGHDIIRTWAFYTILRCKALTGEGPFSEVVVNGMVFGDDGHKMSKSRGNVISPEEVLDKYGADALRLWAANSVPGSDVPFAWKDVKHSYKFLRKFWNAFRFISIHIADFQVDEEEVNLNPLDKWILSKLNRLVQDVTDALEGYNFAHAKSSIQSFIWNDFCDEYIEAVKYRLYTEKESDSQLAAKYTLKTVISTSLKLLSPFVPHFTEEINQYIDGGGESIHLSSWPVASGDLIDLSAEGVGELGVDVIGDMRRFKSASGMPLNIQLKSTSIYTEDDETYHHLIDLLDDIKGTMRIEDLKVLKGQPQIMEKVVEIIPQMNRIGPDFRKDAPQILKYIESTDPQEIAEKLESVGEISVNDLKLTPEYIKTRKEITSITGEKVDIIHRDNLVIEIIK